MKSLFKSLSLLIAITCLVWIAVLWHWQTSDRDISTIDIVLYLGALPLVLFVIAWSSRWALTGIDERSARRSDAAAATKAKPAPTGSGAAAVSEGEAERLATMRLLAGALRCAAGSSAQEVAAAVAERRPALDAELVDAQGTPVLAARIDGLAVEGLSPPLAMATELAQQRDPAWATLEPGPELARALGALAPCLDNIFQALRPWRERLGIRDDGAHASLHDMSAHEPQPARLLLYAAWPALASPFERAVAEVWLHHAFEDRREGVIAPGRIVRPPCDPLLDGPALLKQADEAMLRMRRSNAPHDLVVLLACDSHIGQASILRWHHEGVLRTSRQTKGRVPGEAAAAIVLAPEGWLDDRGHKPNHKPASTGEPTAIVHRPSILQRGKSIDAQGRIDAEVATACAQQAVAASVVKPDAIACLVTDADQGTARGFETHATVRALLAHLDAPSDTLLAGVPCGHVGAASTLITLALAAHRALDKEQACLALSVGDPQWRAALVVRPPPAPAAAPGAAA